MSDDRIFYTALLVLVGFLSFGLGRMSIVEDNISKTAINKEAESYTQRAVPLVAVATSSKEDTSLVSDSVMYVGSKNSDKYHLLWCSGAKRITEENKVFFKSKEEAESAGYKPAGNCPGL